MTNSQNALGQLLGSYLHQDWTEEFASPSDALSALVESESKEVISTAVHDIDSLLASGFDEAALQVILLDEVGCYYAPESDGLTCREWLSSVRALFERQSLTGR